MGFFEDTNGILHLQMCETFVGMGKRDVMGFMVI